MFFSSDRPINKVNKKLKVFDLYFVKKGENSKWKKAKKLPWTINSQWKDYCPSISPDGRYLVFSSNRIPYREFWKKKEAIKSLIPSLEVREMV